MVTCMARPSSRRLLKELVAHIKHLIDKCFNPLCSTTTVHKKADDVVDQTMAPPPPTAAAATTEERDDEGEEGPMVWEVEVAEGVLVTFVSQPGGANQIKKIRFSKEVYNTREAKTWWTRNADKVMELYNVPPSGLPNPCSITSSSMPEPGPAQDHESDDSMHTSRINLSSTTHTSSSTEASASSSDWGDGVDEWEEQDEPGVSVTIRSYPDGTREIRHVNLSRERFSESTARAWWAENKARLHDRYVVFFVF